MRRFASRSLALLVSSALLGCGPSTDASPAASSETQVSGVRTEPDPAMLPSPTGACPEVVDGYVTFSPQGLPPRRVRLWLDPATSGGGPLVFYWHGTGSKPEEATYGLGSDGVTSIKASGGVVAAPEHDPSSGPFPWFLTTGAGREDDVRVADEVLACLRASRGVDVRRIHSAGMSAGGLQTTQLSYRRSGYVASVVTYSGGRLGNPADQDPTNPFAAMIFHGGAKDVVIVNFQDLSQAYHDDLKQSGRFSFLCDHGLGHKIPADARPSVVRFLDDHPFGTSPSPYAKGLPSGSPDYCALD